ncbi:unnamed protein product [Hydatigera taeniaeformis]|uniref:Uncharacterized protein n=1 Tax=Hydatigena taeniaeformis TaxID=6205 RepID=A0A3P7FC58_HYDTA|nr:unnamed protein product [Hydatigera taeniaeformis]
MRHHKEYQLHTGEAMEVLHYTSVNSLRVTVDPLVSLPSFVTALAPVLSSAPALTLLLILPRLQP